MIRGWLPSHMAYDLLFNTVYYFETLVYAMSLGALILVALEDTHRQLRSLLVAQVQTGKDEYRHHKDPFLTWEYFFLALLFINHLVLNS